MTARPASAYRFILGAFVAGTIAFLILPTLIVIPLGFSSSAGLDFPPPGFSLRWFERLFADRNWAAGLAASAQVAVATAIAATVLGTLAALGIVRGQFPGRGLINVIIVSPLVVPVIIVAVGLYLVFLQWRLVGSPLALIAAHTALAVPFVVVNVAASLRTVDRNLELAAMSLGAGPARTFTRITLPLITPGLLAGAVFAFITSWDEVVVASFITSASYRTLPVEMWRQVREQVDPTVAAVSTLLLAVTTILLLVSFVIRPPARVR
jgi:putative spermidine/putrescine transport system permease protein